MGNTGVAYGYRLFDADINPANLVFLNERFGSAFQFHINRNEDKRSFPMYNFFDGYVDDVTYVSNENYFKNISFGLHGNVNFTGAKLAFGFLYTPVINFDCRYHEQVRNDANSDSDNYPPIIAKNLIEGDGSVNQIGFILALSHHERFAWGLKISKLTGEQDYQESIFWTQNAISLTSAAALFNEEIKMNRKFDAIQFSFGGNYKVSERLNIGFSFTPSSEFDVTGKWSYTKINAAPDTVFSYIYGDIDTLVYSFEADWQLNSDSLLVFGPTQQKSFADFKTPTRTRFGITYKPQNIMRTNLNIDFEHVKWSDVNGLFSDEMNYYIGVEHQVSYSMPLRIGFKQTTNYQISNRELILDDVPYSVYFGNKITMPGYTIGTGFTVLDKITVDISGEFTHRKYETLDLFPDSFYNKPGLWSNITPADRGWENPDTVKESFTTIKLAVSYKW
jgi:hypothetical protein